MLNAENVSDLQKLICMANLTPTIRPQSNCHALAAVDALVNRRDRATSPTCLDSWGIVLERTAVFAIDAILSILLADATEITATRTWQTHPHSNCHTSTLIVEATADQAQPCRNARQ